MDLWLSVKGSLAREFQLQVFFMNQFPRSPLGPFRIFSKIRGDQLGCGRWTGERDFYWDGFSQAALVNSQLLICTQNSGILQSALDRQGSILYRYLLPKVLPMPSLWCKHGAGNVMEGWPCTAFCLA
jgi:hypothetical protein